MKIGLGLVWLVTGCYQVKEDFRTAPHPGQCWRQQQWFRGRKPTTPSRDEMRTLIYKRTHSGDPDSSGQFGIHDCMGQVRAWAFDSVIGVGGIGAEPRRHGLAGKVNWIGIGARRKRVRGKDGFIVTFDRFLYYGADGPSFRERAPKLARRMYSRNVRVVIDALSPQEKREVQRILALAKAARPSTGRVRKREAHRGQCDRGCACPKPSRSPRSGSC